MDSDLTSLISRRSIGIDECNVRGEVYSHDSSMAGDIRRVQVE